MAKYTYKGIDIGDLIVQGSTAITNYNGLTYTAAENPNYTTERPLPFSITQQGTDISTKMDAKYVEFTTGSGTYSIPSVFNGFRAVLEGGGGGSGGAGGGGNGPLVSQQKNGGGGTGGLNGGFIYVSDVLLSSPIQISYAVGEGGGGGADGAPIGGGTVGKGTPGDPGGTGGSTNISFQTYSIMAGGGGGGDEGNAGTSTGNSGNIAGSGNDSIASTSNYNSSAIVIVDTNNPIPPNVNPLGYLVNRSLGGPTDGGPSTGTGKPGYIRLYLLRD